MKKCLLLIACLAFSLSSFAQLSLENTSTCDMFVQLYTVDSRCQETGHINYTVPANGGHVIATPPAGEEFVYAEVTASRCSSSGLALEPGCTSCNWGGNNPSDGNVLTYCDHCQKIVTVEWHCNNHFIMY